MEMRDLATTVLVARRVAIFALDSINVSPEHIVCKVPAGHVLLHVFLVYDLTILAQVLPSSRGNSQVALAFVVALEESQGITTYKMRVRC